MREKEFLNLLNRNLQFLNQILAFFSNKNEMKIKIKVLKKRRNIFAKLLNSTSDVDTNSSTKLSRF